MSVQWIHILRDKTALILLAATIPLSLFLPAGFGNVSVIIFFIYALFNAKSTPLLQARNYAALALIALFILYIVGLFFSSNLENGLDIVGRKYPLLLIPVAFIALKPDLTKTDIHRILAVIAVVCLLLSIFLYGRALLNIIQNRSVIYPDQIYRMYYYAYIPLTQPFEPIYLSLYSNLAFLVVLQSPLIVSQKLRVFLCIYLGVFIVLIAAKGGIIAFILILLSLIIKKGLSKLQSIILVGATLLFAVVGVQKFTFLKERFDTSFNVDLTERNGGRWSSTALRIAIWSCAIDALANSDGFGYGTGDGQAALEQSYQEKGFAFGLFYKDHPGIPQYNPHSELLSVALDLGIAGGLILILIFLGLLFNFLKTKDFTLLGFIIVTVIYFSVESVLMRQKGILFFSFFCCFLPWGATEKAKEPAGL